MTTDSGDSFPSEWAAIESQARADVNRLDVVRACRDLRGRFPKGVEIRFVFWAHGKAANPTDRGLLAPHVVDADVVGMEIVDAPLAPSSIERTFEIVNAWLVDEMTKEELTELHSEPRVDARSWVQPVADRLNAEFGRQVPPVFVPIDDYAGRAQARYPSRLGTHRYGDQLFDREARRDLQVIAYREQIVVRQLHKIALGLGDSDGTPKVLAAAMGERHWLLEIAAEALGAKTSRVFATPREPPFAKVNQEMQFRFRGSFFSRALGT